MRFIPTRVHGIVDYLLGVFLILMPWLLGFARGGAETWLPVVLGLGILGQSLFTDYEWGLVRRIDMGTHLGLDGAAGAVLAIGPWLFGFDEWVWVPFVVVGLLEIGLALTTETLPSDEQAPPTVRRRRPAGA